jgi:crossover junction endodeoxyribonuclease RuvC
MTPRCQICGVADEPRNLEAALLASGEPADVHVTCFHQYHGSRAAALVEAARLGMPGLLLGVDVGVRGGLAIVAVNNGAAPQLIDAIDIPTIGEGAKERVDVTAIRAWLTTHKPQHAYVERAQAMPKQGVSSSFKYGRAVGAIEAAIVCCEIPLTVVEPNAWKKFYHLRGKDKEGGRQRALQLFPAAHGLLARKRDHGRAEAALIVIANLVGTR